MSKTIWIVVAVIAIIAVGGWYMMKNGQTVQAPATNPVATAPAAMEATPPVGTDSGAMTSGQDFTVSGSEFMFAPATLTAKVGEPVTITFNNTGTYPHNFMIKELSVASKTIKPGESDSVTFTPDKAGTYTYYCGIPGHEAKGMKGTLTVQ